MDSFEKGPIFQHTSAGHKFSQALYIRPPEFGADGQYGFGFDRKIKRFLRFGIVNAMHSVSIVEKRCRPSNSIPQKPMKSSIQARWEGRLLLIQMNQIGAPVACKSMPLLL